MFLNTAFGQIRNHIIKSTAIQGDRAVDSCSNQLSVINNIMEVVARKSALGLQCVKCRD